MTDSVPPDASRAAASELKLRFQLRPSDRDAVRSIVESTGFFYPPEVDVAVELVDENLAKGAASGYYFALLDDPHTGLPLGYACYGPIACTMHSFDLYWIAVDKSAQGCGHGQRILTFAEQEIRQLGGLRLYAETSGREQYAVTRSFYQKSGFSEAAVLTDFYDQGDDKVIYLKILTARQSAGP